MKSILFEFLGWFTPEEYEQDSSMLLRAHVLVGTSFFIALVTSSVLFVRWFSSPYNIDSRFFQGLFVILISFLSPFLLRISRKLSFAGSFLIFLSLCTVLIGAYDARSVNALHLIFLPAIFGVSSFLLKARITIFFLLGSTFALLFVASTHVTRLESLLIREALDISPYLRAVCLLVSSLFVMCVVFLYELGRDRIEEALKLSEDRNFLAMQGTGDGLFDWNIEEEFVHLSEQFESLLGFSPNELALQTFFSKELVFEDDFHSAQKLYERIKQGTKEFDVDLRLLTADGKWKWFQVRGGVLFLQSNPIRIIGSIRDVTERKQLNELKSEFVANVSHELRTPLTSILGSLGLAQQEESLSKKQRSILLGIAERNAKRLLSIVNDLLDFQRLEQGHVELDRERVSAITFLTEAISLHQSFAERQKVKLIWKEKPSKDIWMMVDVERLHQVVGNLLSNAIKVSAEDSEVFVGLDKSSSQLTIIVGDYGPGIPLEMQPHLFHRFSRKIVRAQKNMPGTGLGLAIAKSLVEAHGGSISYKTVEGEGTEFFVTLSISTSHVNSNEFWSCEVSH